MQLNIFSGGAAQAVVGTLQKDFEAAHGCTIAGTFNAVGAMRDAVVAGQPCDLVILSASLVESMTREGHLVEGSGAAVGGVATSVAVRSGTPAVKVGTGEELRQTLAGCKGLFVPHLTKSTAGQHVAAVLKKLGLDEALKDRIHEFPNGATAMAALAQTSGDGMVGCTQATEIMYTAGIDLVADLPQDYGLVTVYTAAVCTRADQPALAAAFRDVLCGAGSRAQREAAGFRI
jgi:molybdate transport system substrate-binding protein